MYFKKFLIKLFGIMLFFVFITSLPFPLTFAQPEQISNADPLISILHSIDSQITVVLVGTLAGLAVASAGFLLSTQSQIQRTFDEKQEKIEKETNSARKSHLQRDIEILSIQIKIIQKGVTNLVWAFFLFISNMITLLLLFDSVLQQIHISLIDNVLGVIVETIPFLIGIFFFVLGANSIRKVYSKRN